MKHIYRILSVIIFISCINLYPQQKKVFLAHIESEIDLGLAPYITRIIKEAHNENADAIIFKINTLGGRVDAAVQIVDAIVSSKILTIAFIDHRAISAGAFIALANKKIVMVQGGSIGAATVVDASGQKVGEKYQSFMRGQMRSVAEKNGRPVDICQGMVDERIVVPGVVDSTQLITLTTEEAIKYGIADTTAAELNDVLKEFDLQGAQVIDVQSNWAEDVVKFLNNPIISSILMMIGFVGLFVEIKTPGWGLPGTAGVIALALFFGSSYILDLASGLDILLFVVGIILLALEIFVIPGFGVAGIAGIVLIFASLFMALIGTSLPFIDSDQLSMAIVQLGITLLISVVIIYFIVRFLPKSNTFNKLILADDEQATKGFVSSNSLHKLVGKEGKALTTLRPAGMAEIRGEKVDVIADGDYVQQGSKLKVIRVEGSKVIVKMIK
ncbi:MAG TPA: NfeD family protein [Ignavibacteriaceae bacterium]|nr:NfeD family protein [Ignavibacteriaceae bacterium]